MDETRQHDVGRNQPAGNLGSARGTRRPSGRPHAEDPARASVIADRERSRSHHVKRRIEDVFVCAAAADIAGEIERAKAERSWGHAACESLPERHDHTGHTKAALQRIIGDECCLQRVQGGTHLPTLRSSLDLGAIKFRDRQSIRQANIAVTVEQNGAGATRSLIACDFRPTSQACRERVPPGSYSPESCIRWRSRSRLELACTRRLNALSRLIDRRWVYVHSGYRYNLTSEHPPPACRCAWKPRQIHCQALKATSMTIHLAMNLVHGSVTAPKTREGHGWPRQAGQARP